VHALHPEGLIPSLGLAERKKPLIWFVDKLSKDYRGVQILAPFSHVVTQLFVKTHNLFFAVNLEIE
jgi:hypothetical protein